MPAVIETLIDKQDVSEIVRDQVAAILTLEQERQQELAVLAEKDPALWKLDVFLERSEPWGIFQDHPETAAPVVSVSLRTIPYDKAASNAVESQRGVAQVQVDCYGYGKAADIEGGGHQPADEKAAFEAQRAVRLVRNILMAGHYTHLGLRKTVEERWLREVTFVDAPRSSESPTVSVVAGRMLFEIKFREFAPQVQGVPIELLFATVKRAKDGRLYFAAQYGDDS